MQSNVRMNRRTFLQVSGAALCGGPAFANAPTVRLTVFPDRLGPVIAEDFMGLSYETAQLHFPDFFSGSNTDLIALVRGLGAKGVLRIGGNTSARSVWTTDDAPAGAGTGVQEPDTGRVLPPLRSITPQAIRNLRDFLDATGWSLIYGLNMGTGSVENAVAEATFVADAVGPHLQALQFCNEPDLFPRNGVRGRDYSFDDFAKDWRTYSDAVRRQLPTVAFAGPDTAMDSWLIPFARTFHEDVAFLTQHHYPLGPPDDPAMTIAKLLAPSERLAKSFAVLEDLRRETGLTFRMAETNSCYGGGKEGVSDTFAAALWGAELMYQVAEAGGTGINFHGGGYGWYTPIAGAPGKEFEARPLYYGMLLFELTGRGRLVATRLEGADPAMTVYAVRGGGSLNVVVFNKSDTDATITIDTAGRFPAGAVCLLTAPSLGDKMHATLGGQRVDVTGALGLVTTVSAGTVITVPKTSAAMVRLA